MTSAYHTLSMEELVDILAQKTQIFTQLMAEKEFSEKYKETKLAIQQILSEIESRKEIAKSTDMSSEELNPGS